MYLFFWKRWPVITLSIMIATGVAMAGFIFFLRAQGLMEAQVRQRLENTAASAALFIDGNVLDGIQSEKDMKKQIFVDVVRRLKSMRGIPDVRFAYIMRKTEDPQTLRFVADADSLSTKDELDANDNGVIEDHEEASYPGDLYDIREIPALMQAFDHVTSDDTITVDQWGSVVSGYSPIRRRDGTVAAVLGIDMKADRYQFLTQSAFTPLALVSVIVAGVILAVALVVLWERRRIAILTKVNAERSGLLKLTFHQLGEPLTIMKWSLETLRDETQNPELKSLVAEHILCMDEGLGRLNSIIDTLQQAEKVDLNTLEYIPSPSSLKTLLDNAVNEWASSIAKRTQKIEVDMAEDLIFPFDHNMIALVLRQLLQNAIEYSPDNSVITVRVKPAHDRVMIEVIDRGYGIPREDMDHLFEKYRRASNAPKHKPDGNGLGLYITRGIIERAGGRIKVESEVGEGTTVSFSLPLN